MSTEQSQQISLRDVLNSLLGQADKSIPNEYINKMYAQIHPGMMIEAIEEAKTIVKSENERRTAKKQVETANVFVTFGGESLSQNFYTGVIATLLWLPKYIQEVGDKLKLSPLEVDTCLKILKEAKLPQVHDIKIEKINDNEVTIVPSRVNHYSAFLSSIVSWLNTGITDFTVEGKMKTNMEMSKCISARALDTFPSVPFGCYHVGSCQTSDIFTLAERIGKSFDWTKFMSTECYMINEPKFVVTTGNAPIVSIAGHPLTDTFIAEVKDGDAKWVGLFIETEEFAAICAKEGLNPTMIKKYIISNTLETHKEELEKKNEIAVFLEKNKIVKQAFELRQQYSCLADLNEAEDYDV